MSFGNVRRLPGIYPRCPEYNEPKTIEELMPYLESVAKRPYHEPDPGLHASWNLKKTDIVLLRPDNWCEKLCVDASEAILDKNACEYEVDVIDRGTLPTLTGEDEVPYYLERNPQIMRNLDRYREVVKEGKYNKIIEGYGGPILPKTRVEICRFPFYTPEMLASPAFLFPDELLYAIDEWTWRKICQAKRVRITDPEGTDLTYSNKDEYYNQHRTDYNDDAIREWVVPDLIPRYRTYQPGHIMARPRFITPSEDARGVIAGTMNHIGAFPYISMKVEKARIYDIRGGGKYGDDLRKVEAETRDTQYLLNPGKGMLYWWEAAIGTNPMIHRPRKDYTKGGVCALYERTRSGIIHMGFGTVQSTLQQTWARKEGLLVSHFHVHLYFATVILEMADGHTELLIENGHLKALDDNYVRGIARKYGNPDTLLSEAWIPAVPGINMEGDYAEYANDPLDWTLTELKICRKFHPLYMKMIAPGNGASMVHEGHHEHHH